MSINILSNQGERMSKSDYNIREAHMSDLPYLYDICLKTGANGSDASDLLKDKLLIGQYFVAPYVAYSPHTCFVVNKDTIPVGYIVGIEDSTDFFSWLDGYWLPILRKRYPKTYNAETDLEKFIIRMIHTNLTLEEFLINYPAQMHIDLLPETQGKGLGKKLMEAFINRLEDLEVPGIHFGVSKVNEKAINFYKKLGFNILKENSDSYIMGMELL